MDVNAPAVPGLGQDPPAVVPGVGRDPPAVVPGVGQDLIIDLTPLPADHVPKFLAEAKRIYGVSRPPFVRTGGNITDGMERAVFVTISGRRPDLPIRANLIAKRWDPLVSSRIYWTLDLNGQRFIVQSFPNNGCINGAKWVYCCWTGVDEEFEDLPIAFTCINGEYTSRPIRGPTESSAVPKQQARAMKTAYAVKRKAPSGLTEHLPEIDEESDSLPSSGDSSSWPSSEDVADQDYQAGVREDQQYSYEDFIKAFDLKATPPLAPPVFHTSQLTSSSGLRPQRERRDKESNPTKRARSHTPPAPLGFKKVKTPTHVTSRAPHQIHHASNDSSGFSETLYETPALTPSTKDPPSSISEAHIPKTQASASFPILTLHQKTHTILRASRDSTIIGFVPLRLLTCMTISTLFSSVITASGHQEHEEPIKCLMAVFDWKDENDVYKTIYIDKGTEDSFEIFLEIINEAPCWSDGGGKCGVAIEIVRA